MREPINITLGGNVYAVRPFNLGQHRKISVATQLSPGEFAFKLIEIALERSEPKVEDFENLEAVGTEVNDAAVILLHENGFPLPDAPQA